jgi:glutathione synthase/RimK-type ligase-like ATP-grasp enzyme
MDGCAEGGRSMRNDRAVGFVTCRELGGITEDDRLIARALAGLGIGVEPVFWDEPAARLTPEAFVVRSPWNYHLDPEAFLGWLQRASLAAPVFNEPSVIRWNAHKGYLFELEAAGIAIAPTVLCAGGQATDLSALMARRGWRQAIVKPAISASSYMTAIAGAFDPGNPHAAAFRARFHEDAQQLLNRILETRDALVQPFMPEIFSRGERCLVFIDGAYSHCVQKEPFTGLPGGGRPVRADPAEIELGGRALGALPFPPLYARVDVLRDGDGVDRLMELELIDPELYLRLDNQAAQRFADALIRRLERLAYS